MTSPKDPIVKDMSNANFPTDEDGRTYHLNTKKGDVANRVLSVGSLERAKRIAAFAFGDLEKNCHIVTSYRGFVTFTGKYKSVPVSIIATGMGYPMMDFVVRETRHCVEGPMAICRFGTCGSPSKDISLGHIIVANSGFLIHQNPDHWYPEENSKVPPYNISNIIPADSDLSSLLTKNFKVDHKTVAGICGTAGSFYSSQGRTDGNYFDDQNSTLISDILKKYPTTLALEMETSHLLHLAHLSKPKHKIYASAAMIVLAQRFTNGFLSNSEKHAIENSGGKILLDTLIDFKFPIKS